MVNKRKRRYSQNGFGPGSPDPVRRLHPWPKGLAGWVMRWIYKRPEHRDVVFGAVVAELENAAYDAVRDAAPPPPLRKGRGKHAPAREPIAATPERVYALAMASFRENRSDVFSGLKLGADLDDDFQKILLETIDDKVRESYGFGIDRLSLDVTGGSLALKTTIIGEEITNDETEVPQYIYDRGIKQILREWWATEIQVWWQFDSAAAFWRSRGTARFVTYPVAATFSFDTADAMLAMFGKKRLMSEAKRALAAAEE